MNFYVIKESHEYTAEYVYVATTKEECEKHIMDFANFWSNRGTCTIEEIDERFYARRVYYYRDGECVGMKDWGKKYNG